MSINFLNVHDPVYTHKFNGLDLNQACTTFAGKKYFLIDKSFTQSNYVYALDLIKLRAEQDDVLAIYQLALRYFYKDEVKRDFGQSIILLKHVAAHHLPTINQLGIIYGIPTTPFYNFKKSKECFNHVIKNDKKEVYQNLGRIYFNRSPHKPKDLEKAKQYFTLAADEGNDKAILALKSLNFLS